MPLIDVPLPPGASGLPDDVAAFLQEAQRRVAHVRTEESPAFVPSDYGGSYRALRIIHDEGLCKGRFFCEWGSGLGVVTGLAAMLGFDACGIEIEPSLVTAARRLTRDFA